ncbi:MAG: 1-deoxy-D-xylulose-5-phosphate reductoisomerase [Proteobacteria bacterium]|nr:1-deoxy-D-xylulose-5-phosphate reductoisomerase [Pseudomonadota bacterium]
MRSVAILGSTGSIGLSTLDVIRLHSGSFHVFALSANVNVDDLFAQCIEFAPAYAAMADEGSAISLKSRLQQAGSKTQVLQGEASNNYLASHAEVDIVVAGIVGAIGLLPTLAAVRAGKTILVANKEPLVMLGSEIMLEARDHQATIVPVDSEHNAIFQCMPKGGAGGMKQSGIEKILLTGSGGPFRETDVNDFAAITPAQACAHPNWEMGRKISVDSATMMNKGLELIEACALFDVSPDFVQIVVHPQSIIHSMVQYVDGSILAQMGAPDMRTPIAHALGWPKRIESGTERLDLIELAHFDFQAPDETKFPALRLARAAAQEGGTLPAILNAANEVAVEAFLSERIGFERIPVFIESAMDNIESKQQRTLESVLEADQLTRTYVENLL